MANLPANNDMTGSAVTQGGFKSRLNDVLDFLRDILGSTGTPASARTALGLGALATKGDVAEADIATGAVTAGKIGSGAVTEPKIGGGAVTSAKIADNAVTAPKILDGAVTTGKVASGAITDGHLAANAVTTAKVADTAITAPKIASNAVTSAKIADGAVTPAKLASGALPLVLVAEANITSAVSQIDLTLPAGYGLFLLQIGDLRPSGSAASLLVRTSIDGVTFASGGSDYLPAGASISLGLFEGADTFGATGLFTIAPGAGGTPRFGLSGWKSTNPTFNAIELREGSRAAVGRQQAIRLFMSAGNINRATIRLLGVV